MEAIVEEFKLKLDSFIENNFPDYNKAMDSHKKELDNKGKDNLEFLIAFGSLYLKATELTSTEKKIAYLLNDKMIYYLLENGHSEPILEAIQSIKEEQEIYINFLPLPENYEEEFKNNIECLEKFEGIVEATVENGFNYYKELVEGNSII